MNNFDPFNENMNDNIRAIYNQTMEYCLVTSSKNIEFNTGKPYCKSGQIIRAFLLNSGDVFFQDLARGIEGILYSRSIAFNPETIELEYLNGRYKDSSLFQVKQIIESFQAPVNESLTNQEINVLRILSRLFSQAPDKGKSKWFINRWFPVITYGDVCGLSPADRAIIADYYTSTRQQDK